MNYAILILRLIKDAPGKATGVLAGGGGLVSVIIFLHGDVTNSIAQAEIRSKEYAKTQVSLLNKDINIIQSNQERMIQVLDKLDRRVYELNRDIKK